MKEKIKEVQNYFADKLARGLYKVVEVDEYCLVVTVDKEYDFALWHCSGADCFKVYDGRGNFMNLKFNEKQKTAGFKKTKVHVKKWEDTEMREHDLAELKKLQAKYPDAK